MDDVAKKCGMSKKTIYQEFTGKEELVKALIVERTELDKAVFESFHTSDCNAMEKMLKITKFTIQLFLEVKPLVMYDLEKYYNNIWMFLQEKIDTMTYYNISMNLKQGQKEGFYREDLDTDFISKIYVQMALAISSEDLFPSSLKDKGILYKSLINYHMRAIVTEKGRHYLNKIDLT